MANIYAINAQGTEYGITAENGISQAQAEAITTIGDVTDLSTTAKTTLVAAINEVNGKIGKETVLYENQNPTENQQSFLVSIPSGVTISELKVTFGIYSSYSKDLRTENWNIVAGSENTRTFVRASVTADDAIQTFDGRQLVLNAQGTTLSVGNGSRFSIDTDEGTMSLNYLATAAKIIKIVAVS